MRYLMFALLITTAMPALAAYQASTRSDFLRGCNQAGAQQAPAEREKLKSLCDCGLAKIEASMPEDQFVNLGTLPDKGMGKLQPMLLSCMNKQ